MATEVVEAIQRLRTEVLVMGGHMQMFARDIEIVLDHVTALSAALGQHGHIVDFKSAGYGIEHPIECRREGLLDCALSDAMSELGYIPVGAEGRYHVELIDGEIVVGGVVD